MNAAGEWLHRPWCGLPGELAAPAEALPDSRCAGRDRAAHRAGTRPVVLASNAAMVTRSTGRRASHPRRKPIEWALGGGEFVFVPAAKAAQLSANMAGALDIVFTQRGANHYRQVAVVPADAGRRFVISQSQMKLTVDRDKVDPLFVYYLFRSPLQQEYLQRNAIQTGVPHTNLSILRKPLFAFRHCRHNAPSPTSSARWTTRSS